MSKLRFQSAQLVAYLTDDLWLRLAGDANARMAELVSRLERLASYGVRFSERVEVNMAWLEMPQPALDAAAAEVDFYRMGPETARLVTSWQTTPEDVVAAADAFRRALAA